MREQNRAKEYYINNKEQKVKNIRNNIERI